jgi:uncharacterized protein
MRPIPRLIAALVAVVLSVGPAKAQQPPTPPTSEHLSSRLMPPKQESICQPNIDPMYSSFAIVTGTDMRQRPWGFALTFREVLVKASADPRLSDDPRAAELADKAERYVACFSYADEMADIPLHDEQGTYDRPHKLTVYFDPAKIDAVLAEFGDQPWRGARPVVVPVLLVHGRKPPPYLLSADATAAASADQRLAFGYAVDTYGMKAHIPAGAEFAAWGISVEHFPFPETTAPTGQGDEAIVAGTLDWDESLPGWVGKWSYRYNGVDHRWGIAGVSFDAAFRDIVRGVMLLASGRGTPD